MVEKGKTILLTSHVLEIVESLCTDIAIINKGNLLYEGTVAALHEQFSRENLNLEEIFIKLIAPEQGEDKLSWIGE